MDFLNAFLSSKEDFQFHGQFPINNDDCLNGININGIYIPEENILNIFSYLHPKDILTCSLVCKRWCNIAKSSALWQEIYNKKEYPKKAKNLPWYVFYCYYTTINFINLVKNANGQEQYKHWKFVFNGGDKVRTEEIPEGCYPLPEGVPEFNHCTSCFATSYELCYKYQEFNLKEKRLLKFILRKYKPTLYLSEWYCGRFDCGSIYKLSVICETNNHKAISKYFDVIRRRSYEHSDLTRIQSGIYVKHQFEQIEQWSDPKWTKVELILDDYPSDMTTIYFCHQGKDTKYWAGHYGSKFAGGVLKFIFNSISPTPDDTDETY